MKNRKKEIILDRYCTDFKSQHHEGEKQDDIIEDEKKDEKKKNLSCYITRYPPDTCPDFACA